MSRAGTSVDVNQSYRRKARKPTDLENDSKGYKALVFALLTEGVPPLLDVKDPGLYSSAFWGQGLEQLIGDNQLALLAADEKELLVLCLEESDAYGKINGHDPELNVAGIISIERVRHQHEEEIHVKDQEGRECEADVAHANNGVLAVIPDNATHGIEDKRVDHSKDDVADTEAIVVVMIAPVIAIRVRIYHPCGRG